MAKITDIKNTIILAPLSLYNQQAIGVVFVAQADGSGYKAFYLDLKNASMPESLAATF